MGCCTQLSAAWARPPWRRADRLQRMQQTAIKRSCRHPTAISALNEYAGGSKLDKVVWVQTNNKSVLTAALEAGLSTFLFDSSAKDVAEEWGQLARFSALFISDGTILEAASGRQVGQLRSISSGAELQALQAEEPGPGCTVLEMSDWQIIPAENLIAAFQSSEGALLPVARSAADARAMLEALEAGTDGAVLLTDEPAQVREVAEWLAQRRAQSALRLEYEVGTVTRVEPVGMGDRVCVDTASLLEPGEGLLVGSFARALFLIHSECSQSAYISSRPFRVNAGPVHAYVAAPGDRTAYLAELASGAEVLVADAAGRTRTALVGRVKVERRPLMLVEAETPDQARHSLLVQNAETVRLVGLPAEPPGSSSSSAAGGIAEEQPVIFQMPPAVSTQSLNSGAQAPAESRQSSSAVGWRAVSVSELKVGDKLFVRRQAAARHTGISISESITER